MQGSGVVIGMLLLALGLAAQVPQPVSAMVEGCRTDPIITLSNGDRVKITVDIATAPANVSAIHYTLHAPPGVTLRKIVYTQGGLDRNESFTLLNDGQPGSYITDTVVDTFVTVAVSTTSTWASSRGTATGYGKDTLSVTLP